MPDPVSATIGIGLGVSAGASYLGARSQAKAQRRSEDILKQSQERGYLLDQEKLDLAKALIAEGKPWRDAAQQAGLDTLPLVLADVNREPGTGPVFTTGLKRGIEAIQSELAPYGLTDSSVSGKAIGNLSEGLLASDTAAIRDARMRLLGLPQNNTGIGVGLLSGTGADPLAAARAGVAGQDPYASIYGDVAQTGSTIGSLGLLKLLKF